MRFVVLSNRMRCLNQVAAIGILAIAGAGCSSDFSRFDAAEYSSSIAANQVSAPQANPYPAGVDPVTTASISRSAVARPPQPGGFVNGGNQTPQSINPYPAAASNPYPDAANTNTTSTAQTQGATTYNTYNTYNTYQTRSVSSQSPVSRQSKVEPPKTYRPDNNRDYVDPITTSSLKPARAANVKPVVNSRPKPVRNSAAASGVTGWTGIGGTAIRVKEGETLYNISKRYGVPVSALKKANKITNADQVVAGQQIIIPTYIYAASVPVSAPDNDPGTRAARATTGMIGEVQQSNVAVPTRSPIGYNSGLAPMSVARTQQPVSNRESNAGSSVVSDVRSSSVNSAQGAYYLVSSGDNLGSIAARNNVSVKDLMRANGLSGSTIKVGQKLIIPGRSSYQAGGDEKRVVGLAPMEVDRRTTASVPKPYVKPGRNSEEIDEAAPARTGIETFRWPATGKVFSKFGDRRRGAPNNGIDILVPEGTAVKAAENGVVIYSDNELQEYGNLLLVRHADGWVSAYAHNKTLNVKRGEKVRRGQVIAKSGRTGNAERPMIHFELRKDSNPVNPQKYLR